MTDKEKSDRAYLRALALHKAARIAGILGEAIPAVCADYAMLVDAHDYGKRLTVELGMYRALLLNLGMDTSLERIDAPT